MIRPTLKRALMALNTRHGLPDRLTRAAMILLRLKRT